MSDQIERVLVHYENKIKKLEKITAELREGLEFYAVKGLANVNNGDKIDSRLVDQFYINGGYAREILDRLAKK